MTYSDWVGRVERRSDVVHATPVRALAATLDLPGDEVGAEVGGGDRLPELWHWLYCLPLAPRSTLGRDGHPARGGFLPPIPQERRMWAGGRLRFHHDLRVGDEIERTSEITSVEQKDGRTGPLVLVTVRHTISGPGGVAVEEDQDIVYVDPPPSYVPPRPDPLPDDLDWREDQPIDPVLLFRFSALTFNGHRIHYDRTYCTDVEHYPGLVVHGPLQAVLLMQAGRRHQPDGRVATFGYRARRPLFDFDTCVLSGRATDDGTEVLCANGNGDVTMRATLTWGRPDG